MSPLLMLLVGLAVGAIAVVVALRPRLQRAERERDQERAGRAGAELRVAELSTALEHERRTARERAELRDELSSVVAALTTEAHREAREELEQRQRALEKTVEPISRSLSEVDRELRALERVRSEAYGRLTEQLQSLSSTQLELQRETANLVKALRAPAVRGRWGEMHLRRAIEVAGLVSHTDFVEQATAGSERGALRPDVVVRLPGGRNVVIDAKVPLEAYLEALEATSDEIRAAKLLDHARQLREHVLKLSSKGYAERLASTPDFVLLFVPVEAILGAALEQDPTLLEEGFRRGVHIVTPTSLISNLRAVAQIWRDEAVAEHARTVGQLGKELYERLSTLAEHFARLGRGLDSVVGHYNSAVGSLETRVLVTARKFSDLGVPAKEEIASPDPVERAARPLQAPELAPGKNIAVELPRRVSEEGAADDDGRRPSGDVADAA